MLHTNQKGRSLGSAVLSLEWLGRFAEKYPVVGMVVCGVLLILTHILAIVMDPDHYAWMVTPSRIFGGVTFVAVAILMAYSAITYFRKPLRTLLKKSQRQT